MWRREREREAKTVSKRDGGKVLSCSWPAVGRYPPPEVQGSFLKAHRRRKEDPKTHTHYRQSKQRERTWEEVKEKPLLLTDSELPYLLFFSYMCERESCKKGSRFPPIKRYFFLSKGEENLFSTSFPGWKRPAGRATSDLPKKKKEGGRGNHMLQLFDQRSHSSSFQLVCEIGCRRWGSENCEEIAEGKTLWVRDV